MCLSPPLRHSRAPIPQELIDMILDQVEDDETLTSCTLVNRNWTQRSQKYLFHTLCIHDKPWYRLQDFLTFIISAAQESSRNTTYISTYVTKLQLSCTTIDTPLLAITISSLPRLEELHLHDAEIVMPLDSEEEEAYNRKQLEEDEGASLVTITCPPKSLKRLALDNVMISGKDHAECAFIVAQFLNAFSTIDHLYCNKVGFYATCQIDIDYNDWEEMLEEASEVIGEHFEVGMISVSAKPEQTRWFLYLISFTPKADSVTSFYAQITEEWDTGSIHTMFQCFGHSLQELIFDTLVDPPNSEMLRKTYFPQFDYGALLKLHTVRMLFPCYPTPPPTDDNSLESIVDSITALLEGVRDDTIEHLSIEFTSIPLRFQMNEKARLNEWSEIFNRIISRKFQKSFEELSFVFWQHTYNEDTRNFENLIETEFSEFDKKAMLRIEIHPPETCTTASSYPFRRIDECQIRPRMRMKREKGEYVYSREEGKEE